EDVSLGGFGLAVIVGYVAGQVAQAGGAILEAVYWRAWRGRPTDWVRTGRGNLLTLAQRRALEGRIPPLLDLEMERRIGDLEGWGRGSVAGRLGAAVGAAGRTGRLEMFNANYGLMRGVAVVLLGLAFAALAAGLSVWLAAGLGALVAVAVWRMHRFGRYYARE